MTREKAKREIDSLDYYLQNHTDDYGEESHTAMMMAIKALEQEECDDCISREHLLGEIKSLKESPWFKDNTNCAMAIRKEAIEIVEDLCIRKEPSVNPQEQKIGHWIETAEEYYKAVNEYGGGVNEYTQYFLDDDIACSVCLAMYSVIDNETERFDFCPSCGSKMVDPKESEVKE